MVNSYVTNMRIFYTTLPKVNLVYTPLQDLTMFLSSGDLLSLYCRSAIFLNTRV